MKSALFSAAIVLVATSASALTVRPPASAAASGYICENHALSRVALRSETAPCCAGSFGCAQLLSNTGLVKPKRSNRT